MVRTGTGRRKKKNRANRPETAALPRAALKTASDPTTAVDRETPKPPPELKAFRSETVLAEEETTRVDAEAARPSPNVATDRFSQTILVSTADDEEPGPEPEEAEEIQEWLVLRLGDERYAVELLKVMEIIRPVPITAVPRAPHRIEGIIALRGTVLPVFDLRSQLGLKEVPPGRKTRIVVVQLSKGMIAFVVDEVTEVVKIRPGEIEPPPAGTGSAHLRGIGQIGGRMLILLDVEKAVSIV